MQRLHRDALLGSIKTPQDVDALGIIEPAGLGRLDGAAVAGQQTDTEFGLELLDVLGNAGLGGALALGRGGEGRRLAYRDKGPDLAQGDHRMPSGNLMRKSINYHFSTRTQPLVSRPPTASGNRHESRFLHHADPSARQGLATIPEGGPRSLPAGGRTGIYRSLCR